MRKMNDTAAMLNWHLEVTCIWKDYSESSEKDGLGAETWGSQRKLLRGNDNHPGDIMKDWEGSYDKKGK